MKKLCLLIASLFASSIFCACDAEKDSSGSSDSTQSEISSSIISSEETEKTLYYETKITFYVNPIKAEDASDSDSQYGVYGMYGQQVMDNMVDLLNSGEFWGVLLQRVGNPAEDLETLFKFISESVEYSYYNEISSDNPLLSRSFIYANISVSEEIGGEFANDLYTAVVEITPVYVEENMAVPSGYTGTRCSVTIASDLTEEWK
ncbi:MAG: hypothetical protein IJV83_01745 [Clostridia bacterium]|nr:hypothetical protein [Clostridia bacterium]